jgi:hypothetical protein
VLGRLLCLSFPLLAVSCQVKPPYAPPPQPAVVESVEVAVIDFEGRPDVYATVKGRLSTTVAILVDAKQSREERTLFLEVLEQTPRGAVVLTDLAESPPFETRIPIETLGLEPGRYTLNANGILTEFEIPQIHATLLVDGAAPARRDSAITLVDEFIPIEEITPVQVVH